MVKRAVELAGGLNSIIKSGDTVLIKAESGSAGFQRERRYHRCPCRESISLSD